MVKRQGLEFSRCGELYRILWALTAGERFPFVVSKQVISFVDVIEEVFSTWASPFSCARLPNLLQNYLKLVVRGPLGLWVAFASVVG